MSPNLKKNPAENYMAPDPANFLHQYPQNFKGSVAANSDITILWILAAMLNRLLVMSILHGQWYHVISTLAARSPNIEKIQIM